MDQPTLEVIKAALPKLHVTYFLKSFWEETVELTDSHNSPG